jgi:hypothetical protein
LRLSVSVLAAAILLGVEARATAAHPSSVTKPVAVVYVERAIIRNAAEADVEITGGGKLLVILLPGESTRRWWAEWVWAHLVDDKVLS